MLPSSFERRMRHLLGPGYSAFAEALEAPPPVSIRLNPSKPSSILPAAPAGTVPWHPNGVYLAERPSFTLDPLLHAGAYYVQEASSMFLYEALRQTVPPEGHGRVLDLCAAPGGKSSLLTAALQPETFLVSNELIRSRVGALRENLEKWGAANVCFTSADATDFSSLSGFFDLIVVDAPCSGEGLFRKDPRARQEWSPGLVELCAGRQRRILTDILPALAPNGLLIYCTCTYNPDENDDMVAWLVNAFDLETVPLAIPPEWGIVESGLGYHFFPHMLRGEGFFLSVMRRNAYSPHTPPAPDAFRTIKALPKNQAPAVEAWLKPDHGQRFFVIPTGEILAVPENHLQDLRLIDQTIRQKWVGTLTGAFKGNEFIPAHALALSLLIRPDLPAVDLTREQARLFLKKETFPLPEATLRGWTLARYEHLPLGWMKVLPGRFNNYLPNERRIRMDLQ